jgi:selenocysteine-specific elongation factor
VRRVVLGTAGHIDHGKTALIKALTGVDTDRLKEEKERGISIDLGFARMDLPGGIQVGVVDVPGHERFIKNMLSGVGGIDAVLFVVASDEGIMPQTREHFDIISLLGVRHAVFAITKTDLVEPEMVELVREEVGGLIAETPLAGSPIIPTSATTGRGLDELRRAIMDVIEATEDRALGGATRLPVDRVFVMSGFGTVVTGTLWSGTIARDDRLEVLPGGMSVRVRGVEVHDEKVEKAYAGQRTAVALHGVDKAGLRRGHSIVTPGEFEAVSIIDTELYLLPSVQKKVRTGSRVRFHLGSSEVLGRIFVIGSNDAVPGRTGFIQIRLEEPVVAAYGDRFVVRSYSPIRTIGGGRILDIRAGKHRKKDKGVEDFLVLLATGSEAEILEALFRAQSRDAELESVRKRLSLTRGEAESMAAGLVEKGRLLEVGAGAYIHAQVLEEIEGEIVGRLSDYQSRNSLEWGMSKEELRKRLGLSDGLLNWTLVRLAGEGRVFTRKGKVRAGSSDVDLSPGEDKARAVALRMLEDRMFKTPSESEIAEAAHTDNATVRKVMNLLVEEGSVVKLEAGLYVHARAIDEAEKRIGDYLKIHGEATAGELKDVLETTRKYAVPILEHLDRLGLTRRSGDKRTLIPK